MRNFLLSRGVYRYLVNVDLSNSHHAKHKTALSMTSTVNGSKTFRESSKFVSMKFDCSLSLFPLW